MKSKFEPDVDGGVRLPPSAQLIDPEAYDASEQRFAASVERKAAPPRFVPEAAREPASNSIAEDGLAHAEVDDPNSSGDPEQLLTALDASEAIGFSAERNLETATPGAASKAELHQPQDSDTWRREVADRVNNYRARRRPRAPRYPSLQLKFDPPEPSGTAPDNIRQSATNALPSRLAVAMQATFAVPLELQPIPPATDATDRVTGAEASARILEFPRSPALSRPVLDELAESVVDRPRILEVTELLLPPPALGGILMDPVEEPAQERRPGFELPLQAAPLSMRLLAGAIDSLLVLSAFTVFAYIFFKIAASVPAIQQAVGISASLIALFWTAYQYLLLVYAGTTPGLKLARLQLSRFDGAAVPRRIRRWRALASILSGLSIALGYAWCFLDEDQLCWHDRITRTYMAPRTAPETHEVTETASSESRT
jgi:uncharacterized RDD family membrane protein YckC